MDDQLKLWNAFGPLQRTLNEWDADEAKRLLHGPQLSATSAAMAAVGCGVWDRNLPGVIVEERRANLTQRLGVARMSLETAVDEDTVSELRHERDWCSRALADLEGLDTVVSWPRAWRGASMGAIHYSRNNLKPLADWVSSPWFPAKDDPRWRLVDVAEAKSDAEPPRLARLARTVRGFRETNPEEPPEGLPRSRNEAAMVVLAEAFASVLSLGFNQWDSDKIIEAMPRLRPREQQMAWFLLLTWNEDEIAWLRSAREEWGIELPLVQPLFAAWSWPADLREVVAIWLREPWLG